MLIVVDLLLLPLSFLGLTGSDDETLVLLLLLLPTRSISCSSGRFITGTAAYVVSSGGDKVYIGEAEEVADVCRCCRQMMHLTSHGVTA